MQILAPEENPVTAVLVSRPGVLQQALHASLTAFADIALLRTRGDGLSALHVLAQHRPQLLVVDANLLDEEVKALLAPRARTRSSSA